MPDGLDLCLEAVNCLTSMATDEDETNDFIVRFRWFDQVYRVSGKRG